MNTTGTWHQQAAQLPFDGRAVIDGKRREVATGHTTTDINPATNEPITQVASAGRADIDRAVESGRAAFADRRWAGLSADDRKAMLSRLADLIDQNADELALLDSLDMGKPVREARDVDVPGVAGTYRWYAEAIDKLTDEIPSTPPGSTALVTREPAGVVAAITPWNYPLEIASWKIAPALALGNSVIHKPATQSPLSMLRLADLALEAGIPEGVLNVVPGPGSETGKAIGTHPDIDVLTFTGSTTVAKTLLGYSGQSNMKRLSLEAGGKSANVVFADTDNLRHAAKLAASAAFYNQGEVCSANCRLIVERSIHDEFVRLVAEESAAYLPGDPLDPASGTGSLVNKSHADDVWQAIEKARADGHLLHGGDRHTVNGSDAYITPTIVGQLPTNHPALQNEIFGPLLTVETFDTDAEAITLANNTKYGLAASLWTGSLSRAHDLSRQLVAGTISVNTTDALGVTTPFGGVKQSGFGKDLSLHALDNYSTTKTTWIQYA